MNLPRPPRSFAWPKSGVSQAPLASERLGYGNPWLDLLALPTAFFFAWLMSLISFGRMLLVPIQIQFHELGHALVAWLSSRAALPLPFGFTFWHEEPSRFVALCMLFLIVYFIYRASREGRPFGVALGCLLLGAWLWLSHGLAPDRSMMCVIAGGVAGEFALSALVLVAFYFPLPDRLRWDFFRFLVLFPAAAVWLAATRLWLGVAHGSQELPRGSILGRGDSGGDLDRLLFDYALSSQAITRLYLTLAALTGALWFITYLCFALRALPRLQR